MMTLPTKFIPRRFRSLETRSDSSELARASLSVFRMTCPSVKPQR